jgi:hypothetical protein
VRHVSAQDSEGYSAFRTAANCSSQALRPGGSAQVTFAAVVAAHPILTGAPAALVGCAVSCCGQHSGTH